MSDLVGNPNCWFSHVVAHLLHNDIDDRRVKKLEFQKSTDFNIYVNVTKAYTDQ